MFWIAIERHVILALEARAQKWWCRMNGFNWYLSWALWLPLLVIFLFLTLYLGDASNNQIHFWLLDVHPSQPRTNHELLFFSAEAVLILLVLLIWIGVKNYRIRKSYMSKDRSQ